MLKVEDQVYQCFHGYRPPKPGDFPEPPKPRGNGVKPIQDNTPQPTEKKIPAQKTGPKQGRIK